MSTNAGRLLRVKGWLDYRWAESIGGEPVAHQQTREATGVNEYPSIDPDGPLTPTPEPVPPVPLTYDAAGNLRVNPLVCNPGDVCEPGMPCGMGSPICGSGQRYVYDQENRLTTVYKLDGPDAGTDADVIALSRGACKPTRDIASRNRFLRNSRAAATANEPRPVAP